MQTLNTTLHRATVRHIVNAALANMGEPPMQAQEWACALENVLYYHRFCGYWDACEAAITVAQARASWAPLAAAYARMADPAWRGCNTDQHCNTPRQLWAQAYCEARTFATQAYNRQF